MKGFLRVPSQRSIGYILVIYVIIIVLVLLWAAQMLGTITRNDPGRTPVLLIVSILFPAALLGLTAVNLARIIAQRRAGTPGSRLRLQLIASFATIVFVTAAPLGVLAGLFLRTAIGLWLAPGTGQALESGHRMVVEYYDEAMGQLGDLSDSDFFRTVLEDQDLETADRWELLTDVTPELSALHIRRIDGTLRLGDPRLFLGPENLDALIGEGPLPRRIMDHGTVLSWKKDFPDYSVVLSSVLPRDFESQARLISGAVDEWHRYDRLRSTIGGSLALFGFFLSGPLILMSLLIGMTLSDRVIRPLVALGEATTKISEGDFSFRVLSPKEDELAFLTQSFNKMIRELELSRTKLVQTEKVAAWQVIAQRLAHELRNPLTPIKLSAQRVQRKSLEGEIDTDTTAAAMDLILREVDGLDQLLQDFREFAGGGSPQFSRMKLRPLLEETLNRFRTVNSSIEWNLVAGDEDPEVSADGLQIRQVLVNLLKNAMEAGADRISARLDLVHRGTTPYVRIQIRDNGEGISNERSASVFQPYDSTRDRGSGLGLAVVQRIVYDHQGRIWFESAEGTGTVFYIDIPVGENR